MRHDRVDDISRRTAQARVGTLAAAVLMLAAMAGAALAQPKVVVTIKPLHALVAQVMEGVGTPALLVDGIASPHTYALKPSDSKLLNDADIVFRASATLETFMTKVARALPKTVDIVTLDGARGVTLLTLRIGATFEKEGSASNGHGHDHGHGAKAGAARDAHIWLDPVNAKAMIDRVVEVLAKKDAARADTYTANAVKAKAGIDALDAEIARDLVPVAGKPFIVFHDAVQYFEKRYGLKAAGSITVSPEVPPSGKRIADLRAKIGKLGATCVFSEPNFEAKVVQSVIEGTPARTAVLDPEGARLPAGPGLYSQLMRGLAKSMKDCLSGQPG